LKKIITSVALTGAVVSALLISAGAASAADINGDTAPHSTGDVNSLINGDVDVLKNVTVPVQIAVPVIGSKVGPYQGGNENAAPQADGDLMPVTNGG